MDQPVYDAGISIYFGVGLVVATVSVLVGGLADGEMPGTIRLYTPGGAVGPNERVVQIDGLPTADVWDAARGLLIPPHERTGWAAKARKEAKTALATSAENARQRFITPGYGKGMAYARKGAEVERWDGVTTPTPELYPWAAKRAFRIGSTIEAVLADWRQQMEVTEAVGILIEDRYDEAWEAIKALPDGENLERDATAIIEGITWPHPPA